MVKFVSVESMQNYIKKIGFQTFVNNLVDKIKEDFSHWETFEKSPRHSIYSDYGVVELMPVANNDMYAYKYVNGHLHNPELGLSSIVGYGGLASVKTGFPMLLSEMTILTSLRTAATSLLAAKYLAKKDSSSFGIIGNGSQSEFQTLVMLDHFPINTVYYYDIDPKAMEKFRKNIESYGVTLVPVNNVEEMLSHRPDIITTCTIHPFPDGVIKGNLYEGLFINAMGGDSEIKYEVSEHSLKQVDKIVIEYFPQTRHEGEIKRYKTDEEAKSNIYAELWELVKGTKPGRTNDKEIILFDSVGFALEDFGGLRYMYSLAKDDPTIPDINLVPTADKLGDVKNLYSLIDEHSQVSTEDVFTEKSHSHAHSHKKNSSGMNV